MVIERGQKVAFVGKNGEGKSTMIKAIMSEIDVEGVCNIGHNAHFWGSIFGIVFTYATARLLSGVDLIQQFVAAVIN